ncbi:MAG: hypothetical protein AB7E51_13305 [Pseudodesulfovibrio sp.]|jgi:hypothetical protein|uniref:hypothetical protein n=1 Tax=Pseudodesulfovibrio sp. TaxID=2035812 RepID=UPI003D136554
MEMTLFILPVGYLVALIALPIFFGGGGSDQTKTIRHRDEEGPVELFNDVTDPARSYLIHNVNHDDSIGDDSSFDWDDSPFGDDMSSSSMWDD